MSRGPPEPGPGGCSGRGTAVREPWRGKGGAFRPFWSLREVPVFPHADPRGPQPEQDWSLPSDRRANASQSAGELAGTVRSIANGPPWAQAAGLPEEVCVACRRRRGYGAQGRRDAGQGARALWGSPGGEGGGAGGASVRVAAGLRTSRLQASTGRPPSWRCACSPSSWSSSSRTWTGSSGAPPSLVGVLPPPTSPLSVWGVTSELDRASKVTEFALPAVQMRELSLQGRCCRWPRGDTRAAGTRAGLFCSWSGAEPGLLIAVLALKASDCSVPRPAHQATVLGSPGPLYP